MKHTAFPLLIALAACQAPVEIDAPRQVPPGTDACGASFSQNLVGQPAAVIAAMTFVQGTRIFNTGDALTMDYSPQRLNIEIGPAETIVAVTCG